MGSYQDPGFRPSGWDIAGDHESRIGILEAVPPCCGDSSGVFQTYGDCVLARVGLTNVWPCDDPSGNLVDLVGGTDLTPVVNSGYPIYGQAGPFLALPDETAVANAAGTQARFEGLPSSYATTHPFAVEVLLYPTAAANGTVYEKWDGSVGQIVNLGITGGGTAWGFTRGAASVVGGTVTANAWTLIRVNFTGTALNLYQDDMTTPVATTATASSLSAQANGSFLNNRNTGGGGFTPFRGRAAWLSLYDQAITGDCPTGPGGSTDALEGMVLTADGSGGTSWEFPLEVDY